MKQQRNATRADIVPLIRDGHSNIRIVRELHTCPHWVAQVRADLGLPPTSKSLLTLEEKWATYTRPLDGGHLEWTGPRSHYGTPLFRHGGTRHQAAVVAFRQVHSREPVGYVKAGCGSTHCVAPAHVEDQVIRAQYAAIFGAAS